MISMRCRAMFKKYSFHISHGAKHSLKKLVFNFGPNTGKAGNLESWIWKRTGAGQGDPDTVLKGRTLTVSTEPGKGKCRKGWKTKSR